MTTALFVLTEQASFIDHVRHAVGDNQPLIACSTIETLGRQLGQRQVQAVLVHLSRAVLGDRLPRAWMAELQQVAGSHPIYAVIDEDCPPRAAQLAAEMFDHRLHMPLDGRFLKDCLKHDAHPLDDLTGLYSDLPHRALHGRSKSLVTFTPSMFDIIDELKVPAAHDVTVLLIGETGSGKTHLAKLIHEMSARRDERMLTVACGALPPDLLESELFGHMKGSFTSADREREGKFSAAGRGTLLLDEIDVLPLEQQAKLLRVIETGEYEPVGSNDTLKSQARLVIASNYDLESLVKAGAFRMDLYYRLNMLCFRLLPLRMRPYDIEFLARKFAMDHGKTHNIPLRHIEPGFIDVLRRYPWPGNIRELENVIRRAVLYCQRGVLTAADLPQSIRENQGQATLAAATPLPAPAPVKPAITLEARVDETEKKIIEDVLKRHNNHRSATARELGISRVTLYNKMKKFGMLSGSGVEA